jgi:hypothetical protein
MEQDDSSDDEDEDDMVQVGENGTKRELWQDPIHDTNNDHDDNSSSSSSSSSPRQMQSMYQHKICLSGWSDEDYAESCVTVQFI